MGLIRAAVDSVGGVLGDQWKDFYSVPDSLKPTAAMFPAVKFGQNVERGSNDSGSSNVISNGSKFVVPEGYGLVLMEDGGFTGFVSDPGSYIWDSNESDSQSVFVGNGLINSLIKTSWERFKYGGRPKTEQRAFFVSLKELTNNKFGSASEIYWDDKYLNAQVGATARGTYTLKIADPLTFVRKFVPANYLTDGQIFDFTDLKNDAAQQLFNEVVSSLASSFSIYLNSDDKGNRMTRIQQDSVGFAKVLAKVVEKDYHWKSERGLEIVSTALTAVEYDDTTKSLLSLAQRADALAGNRGNSNLQASIAAGLEAAGSVEGSAGILGLGIASGTLGISNLQQAPSVQEGAPSSTAAKLQELRVLLEEGLITQSDFDSAKAKLLGI